MVGRVLVECLVDVLDCIVCDFDCLLICAGWVLVFAWVTYYCFGFDFWFKCGGLVFLTFHLV